MSQFSEIQIFEGYQKLEAEQKRLCQALIAHENLLNLPHEGALVERLERIAYQYQMRSHYHYKA